MIKQHTKMAVNSLRSSKVRTFLTLLGIIIGVSSVTTIIGLGEGVKHQVNQQINGLGSNLVTVVPGHATTVTGLGSLTSNIFDNSSTTSRLSEADLNSVSQIPNVSEAGGVMQLDGSVSSGPKQLDTKILAVDQNYLDLSKQTLSSGQFFGGDLNNNDTVVLSSDLASSLFGKGDPIGSTVIIRNTSFIVIGVLNPQTGLTLGQPSNAVDTVIIPLPTGKQLNQGTEELQQITVRLANTNEASQTLQTIKQSLLSNHGGEQDFTVTTQAQLLSSTDYIFKILTDFTTAVASISLLVGGIGVMNIMLVTVTERTREIGIRKAVGATKLQIMTQFLTESLVISLFGGIIGIITSLIISYIIQSETAVRPAIDPWVFLLAAGVSVAVGVIFGTWPAIRAARKDPIEALRHDY